MNRYKDREYEIIEKLKQGRSRESIAEDYDYSNWRSLDTYMRRKGYVWDHRREMYELEEGITKEVSTKKDYSNHTTDQLLEDISIKAQRVINRIENNEDPRQIAKELGYKDHRHMAVELKREGLFWDSDEGNYVRKRVENTGANNKSNSNLDKLESIEVNNLEGFGKYLPVLEFLHNHMDQLVELLERKDDTIPKFRISGKAQSKSIYMSTELSKILASFTKENSGITQREVVEASIILFMKKYGGNYKKDIEFLLNKE